MQFLKNVVTWILYQPLINALMFFVWLIPDHNVGWAIIILTVLVRLVLVPSTLASMRQAKRMQQLQPELAALQEKYKDDKPKLSQEMMDFYKKNNIHPLGSCLPLLIQLPILFVLYKVFINGLDMSRFSLLYSFMPHPEAVNTVFFGINLAGKDRFVLPIIAALLQFIQMKQTMPNMSAPAKKDGQPDMQGMISKQMMYVMPIFTLFVAGTLPAALPLYWVVTTLFGIVQQYFVNKEPASKIKAETTTRALIKKQEKRAKLIEPAVKNGIEVSVRKKGQ